MSRRRSRRCKKESQPVQHDQHPNEQQDHPYQHPKNGDRTPANRPMNLHQSSQHQPHHCAAQPSPSDTHPILVDVPPNAAITEQPDSRHQITSDQTEPNKDTSQMTQNGDNSIDTKKRKRSRRARKRRRNTTSNQTTGNLQSNHIANPTGTVSTSYYAIRDGKYGYNGVHTDWDVCVRYLKDTCGATFKSFSTLEEAFEFAHGDKSLREPSQKKPKPYVRPPSVDRKTDMFPIQETESRSLEEVEPLKDCRPLNHGQCLDIEAPRNDRPLEDVRVSHDGIAKEVPQPEVVELQDDPSLEEIRPPKNFQPHGDVRLQHWKVEPVLLPTSLFSSEDIPVKREQTLIPVEPPNNRFEA